MLNEPASSLDEYPPVFEPAEPEITETDAHLTGVRTAVESVLDVYSEEIYREDRMRPHALSLFFLAQNSRVLATYKGRLTLESEAAYDKLDSDLRPHDMVALFRQSESPDTSAPHIIHVIQGRIKPVQGGNTLSIILLILTFFSLLYVGAIQALGEIHATDPDRARQMLDNLGRELWRGWPYVFGLLLILGAHEMGHYLMARRREIAASLPYFLPFPFNGFGTLGAAIRLREPFRNRKLMLDVGAAGPVAGMVFAVPIVLIGLATSQVNPIDGGLVEGNSILYALAKIVVFGRFLPDGEVDVYVNQLAWAGWIGLLVTGLNLLPIGQLDGGHVLYALLGNRARRLYLPIVGGLFVLAVFFANMLLIFVMLLLLLGNYHAIPLDDITVLDNRRRRVAVAMLVLFVLVFVPVPLTEVAGEVVESAPPSLPIEPGGRVMLPVIFGTAWLAHRRRRG